MFLGHQPYHQSHSATSPDAQCKTKVHGNDWVHTILCPPGSQRRSNLNKLIRKRHIIQKNPRIVIVPIEPILNLSNTLRNIPKLKVPDQCHKRCFGLAYLWRVARSQGLVRVDDRNAVTGKGELRGRFGRLFASGRETVGGRGNGKSLVRTRDVVQTGQGEEGYQDKAY